jgi:hypothetical protein
VRTRGRSAPTSQETDAVASHLKGTEVYVVTGYDGPTLDVKTITADIHEEIHGAPKDAIRVVGLPSSIASKYPIGDLPGLLKKASGFGGDVAVVTKKGFRATDTEDADQAFDESKSKGANALGGMGGMGGGGNWGGSGGGNWGGGSGGGTW